MNGESERAAARIVRADPGSPPAVEAMTRYFAELDARFDGGFDAGTAIADAAAAFAPPDGSFLLAWAGDDLAGCGGVQRIDAGSAEIKRMWVAPASRGMGLGRRLLAALEAECRALGCARVLLDTNRVLREAIAMYERAGYRPTDRYNDNPYAHHWFTRDLLPAPSVTAEEGS